MPLRPALAAPLFTTCCAGLLLCACPPAGAGEGEGDEGEGEGEEGEGEEGEGEDGEGEGEEGEGEGDGEGEGEGEDAGPPPFAADLLPGAAAFDTSEDADVVAAGDFDDDEHVDLVVCGFFAVDVWHGDGVGGFAIETLDLPPGLGSCAVGDVDDDGHDDIALARGADGSAVVFYGGADGFDAVTLDGASGFAVDLGDADGDGRLDLLLFDLPVHQLVRATGPRSFGAPQPISGYGDSAFDVAFADIDDDGADEILVTTGSELVFSAGPSFDDWQRRAADEGTNEIAVGRDDDGVGFIAVSSPGTFSITVFPVAAGDVGAGSSASVGERFPRALTVLDVDSDGDLDVVAGDPIATTLVVFSNDAGVFAGAGAVDATVRASAVLGVDVDDDGFDDVVALSDEAALLAVTRGSAAGLAAPVVGGDRFDGAVSANAVATGDVDGDGRDDVVSVGFRSVGVVTAYADDDAAAAVFDLPVQDAFAQDLAVGDLDGDGVDEVVFNGSAGASVYAFDGAAFDLVASAPAVAGPVVFGDLDDDGRGDIVRLDGTGVFVVERGVAGGAFAPAEFFGAAGDEFVTRDLRLCAADDDAVPDVCACTPQGSGGSVSVLSLTGDAVVVSARFDDDDVFVSRCAVFIVDDAVTFVGADSNATAVVVARLSGGALDVVATPGFVNGAPLAFTAADLDGDGSDDIVGVLRGGVVAGFRNAGALGFADARRFVFPDAATLTSTSTALVLAGDGDVRALAR